MESDLKVIIVKIKKFMIKNKWDVFCISLLFLSLPLFFYKLGQSSLVSWDEAWYADIARNVLEKREIFKIYWYGNRFYDHPPAGFWLMAASFKFLGINEYAAMFSQALVGFLTLVVTYLLGKELFNRIVGLSSAVALVSSSWFLYRARSGNLDSFLVFFFVLSVYLAIKATKNKKFLIPFFISLLFLFLTKSVVPFTIIPALVIIFWRKSAARIKDLALYSLITVLPFALWFLLQYVSKHDFVSHYFGIGLPDVSIQSSFADNIRQIKVYLHNSIGKWFYPGILGIFLGALTFKRRFLILSVFFASFFAPFVFSDRGQIWHLIPLHPFMIISFFGFAYFVAKKFVKRKALIAILMFSICIYLSYNQARRNWYEFIDTSAYTSDEEILSKLASEYEAPFYIDGDFVPAAVFYSGKPVSQTYRGGIKPLFEEVKDFLLITNKWRLDEEGIDEDRYEIIGEDRDKVLIKKVK
jgi:4-amino-4-deoxy-L-arabinose transferase-like glycosyltransferase